MKSTCTKSHRGESYVGVFIIDVLSYRHFKQLFGEDTVKCPFVNNLRKIGDVVLSLGKLST
jgi:hypothetical protein